MYEILVGEIVACVVGLYAIFAYSRTIARSKQATDAEALYQKLQLKINEARSVVREFPSKGPQIVEGALGELGIEGIMGELGIDPGILNNPLVKGLVDKYAPRLLEQLAKKTATDEKATPGFV